MLATGNKIRKLSFLLADAIAQVGARTPKLQQHFGYFYRLLLQYVGKCDCQIFRSDANSIGARFIPQKRFCPAVICVR